MEMNPVKAKKATNVRAAGSEEQIKLIPPRIMSLEEMIAYMRSDELVELTPKSIRLRKAILDQGERRRLKRESKNARNS
jgi:GTP-binding protein